MGFTVKKGSEKSSQKGVSRRCLERPLVEYAPLGVRPKNCLSTVSRPFLTRNYRRGQNDSGSEKICLQELISEFFF